MDFHAAKIIPEMWFEERVHGIVKRAARGLHYFVSHSGAYVYPDSVLGLTSRLCVGAILSGIVCTILQMEARHWRRICVAAGRSAQSASVVLL
jgi:hypothetical protein